jgi:hypothetical protein
MADTPEKPVVLAPVGGGAMKHSAAIQQRLLKVLLLKRWL